MPRHPGGRPSKFKTRYCQELIDYFKIPNPNPGNPQAMAYYPTMDGFCCLIGITPQTITDWCKAHEEFSQAYAIAQSYGRQQLVHGGLTEKYNSNFARFVGINIGMISEHTKAETVNQNTHSFPAGINVTFVSADRS